MTELREKRVLWVDNVRAIATVFVVLCHATESIYSLNLEGMKELSNCEQALSLLLFTFGRLGVPMFFFISGYLLLGFEYDERKTRRFYSKNLLGLVVATEIWFLIYQIYNSVFYHKQLLLGECIKTALFMTQTPMTHTWYMPVIIGIYMMIPAVSNALCHANKLFLIPLVFSFIAVFVIPEVNVVMRLRGLPEFSSFLDLNFAGGGYGFCVLLGYILKKHIGNFRKIPQIIWLLILFFMMFITVWLQWYSYHCGVAYNVWYNCATLLLAAFSLTIVIVISPQEGRIIQLLSKYSFGIYLLHVPILQILMRYFHMPFHSLFSIGILTIMVLIISLLCSALCCLESHIARICFFVKIDA